MALLVDVKGVIRAGSGDPNTQLIDPRFIGDLWVDQDAKQLFFAFGMTSSSWGTCGTAGA